MELSATLTAAWMRSFSTWHVDVHSSQFSLIIIKFVLVSVQNVDVCVLAVSCSNLLSLRGILTCTYRYPYRILMCMSAMIAFA